MKEFYAPFSELQPLVDEKKVPLGMTGMSLVVQDEQGLAQDQDFIYMHHFFLSDNYSDEINLYCPEFSDFEEAGYSQYTVIGGFGGDLTPIHLHNPFYVTIPEQIGENWFIAAHLVNPNNEERIAYLQFTLKYIQVSTGDVQVRGDVTSVTGCRSDVGYDMAQGNGIEYRYVDYSNDFSGTVIWAMAHLHRKGISVTITDLEKGDTIVSSRAHYENEEHPEWVTTIDVIDYPNIYLNNAQKLRVASLYDNREAEEDVMGLIMMYIVVDYQNVEPQEKEFGMKWSGFEEDNGNNSIYIAMITGAIGFIVVLALVVLMVLVIYLSKKKSSSHHNIPMDEMDTALELDDE